MAATKSNLGRTCRRGRRDPRDGTAALAARCWRSRSTSPTPRWRWRWSTRPTMDMSPSEHLAELARDTVAAAQDRPPTIDAMVAALNAVMLARHGYDGDAETYNDLRNANLIHAIDRRACRWRWASSTCTPRARGRVDDPRAQFPGAFPGADRQRSEQGIDLPPGGSAAGMRVFEAGRRRQGRADARTLPARARTAGRCACIPT